jgi:hypothetical protein
MLYVIMLIVVTLNGAKMWVVMLSVVIFSVDKLSVMAPY